MLGQQLKIEGDGNENVPLYYYITNNITIQFGREEFCLVIGLRFRVENLGDYNDSKLPIPFRRRVFPSCLDGEHITGNMVLRIIDDELFDRLHDDDVVSFCCLGILQLVLLGVKGKRWIPDWMLRLTNDRGNMPAARLTLDETKARSDWWISSRAYFDGCISQAERVPRHLNRQNMYEVPSEFYRQFEKQKRDLEKQKREIEEIKKMKLISEKRMKNDLSEFPSTQGGPSSFQTHPNSISFFNIGTPTHWQSLMLSQPGSSKWQTEMSSQPGLSNWESQMLAQSATPYWKPAFPSHPEQPPTTVLPKQRGNKNKNNVMKTNLSPLNLGNAFDDENERGADVKRENYVNYTKFLNDPDQIYLDCYMKGYSIPVAFWQQQVPHLCMPERCFCPYMLEEIIGLRV
ncbi:hypothetical protein Tco_0158487 [Tanacetum coccineum]